MTEEDAKAKWCPFSRVASNDGTNGNRHILSADGLNGADKCIASDCMAWRWIEDAEFRSKADAAFRDTGAQLKPDTGYCGLAGKP